MVVNFEFLDEEPLENIITSLYYKIDKMVFFGYQETIKKTKETTENFLKNRCGVKEVEFVNLSKTKLQKVEKTISTFIEKEQGNDIYFDITGGEDLVLVAFGMLAKEYDTPIHLFNVATQSLVEVESGSTRKLSESVAKNNVEFTIDDFISLQGGKVNRNMHKSIKEIDEADKKLIIALNKISSKNNKEWNYFSAILKRIPSSLDCKCSISEKDLEKIIKKEKYSYSIVAFTNMLSCCKVSGAIKDLNTNNGMIEFQYASSWIMGVMKDAGAVLELATYLKMKEDYDICEVGVHMDWDGKINQETGMDVLNEIDVVAMKGCIPTFVSCKNGNVDRHTLYELDTVVKKLGGKYAKMMLIAAEKLADVDALRAADMNIVVGKSYSSDMMR